MRHNAGCRQYGDIHPTRWYLYLLVSAQMLVGVCYSIAILGRGLSTIGGPQVRTYRRPGAVLAC